MKNLKAQVISMDFIMTFVVFIFVLSVFFFLLGNNLGSRDNSNLDIQSELIYSKIDNIDDNYDFMDNAVISPAGFDRFLENYSSSRSYDFIVRDFDDPVSFKKIDYCFYLENTTGDNTDIIRNYAVWDSANYPDDYSVFITGNVRCGTNPTLRYTGAKPLCDYQKKVESIVLDKPVLYGRDIMHLKILICAEKK